MEQPSGIIDQISQLPGWVLAVLHGAAIVALAGWILWRAGSTHVFLARAWTLINGKEQSHDPTVRRWLGERGSLMQFRVMTGVRCRTLREARRLIGWARRHDEEVGDIARCRSYFDLSRPGLKPFTASAAQFLIAGGLTALAAVILLCGLLLATSNQAWVSVKDGSGTSMLLGVDAIRVLHSQQRFDAEDCATDRVALAARVDLPLAELDTACGWFRDSGLEAKVEQTVAEQRKVLAILIAFCLLYGSVPYAWWSSMLAASSMQKRQDLRAQRKVERVTSPAP